MSSEIKAYWMLDSEDWQRTPDKPMHIGAQGSRFGGNTACGLVFSYNSTWIGPLRKDSPSYYQQHPVCPDCLKAVL